MLEQLRADDHVERRDTELRDQVLGVHHDIHKPLLRGDVHPDVAGRIKRGDVVPRTSVHVIGTDFKNALSLYPLEGEEPC